MNKTIGRILFVLYVIYGGIMLIYTDALEKGAVYDPFTGIAVILAIATMVIVFGFAVASFAGLVAMGIAKLFQMNNF